MAGFFPVDFDGVLPWIDWIPWLGALITVLQSLHTQATQRHVQLAKALYATMLAVLQVVCPSPMTSHLRISEVDQAFSRLLVQARGEDHVGLRKVCEGRLFDWCYDPFLLFSWFRYSLMRLMCLYGVLARSLLDI